MSKDAIRQNRLLFTIFSDQEGPNEKGREAHLQYRQMVRARGDGRGMVSPNQGVVTLGNKEFGLSPQPVTKNRITFGLSHLHSQSRIHTD